MIAQLRQGTVDVKESVEPAARGPSPTNCDKDDKTRALGSRRDDLHPPQPYQRWWEDKLVS